MIRATKESAVATTPRDAIRLELLRMIVKNEAKRTAERKAPAR